MSWATGRDFHRVMSQCVLRLAANFEVDNRIVPWDELINSDTLLRELGQAFTRSGWPSRTVKEIRKELLRLHERWKKQQHKSPSYLRIAAENTCLWTDESDDEDVIFMPSKKAKTTSSSKDKAKTTSSSKGKENTTSSSKGKSSR